MKPYIIQRSIVSVTPDGNNFRKLNSFLSRNTFSQIVILVDKNTRKLCLPILRKNIFHKKINILELPEGEENKNLRTCELIWKELEKINADRNTGILNLGGGIICDLGGFAASVYKRGIQFVNIPTTLMAQADSCYGGKTGVNFMNLKNHLGIFQQPKAIFLYPGFLKTISERELKSGFVEICKHGLIADSGLWNKIISSDRITKIPEKVVTDLVLQSIQIKSKIVQQDVRENNVRKLLNFGHTIGHAIESLFMNSKSKDILHGEAVAAGILCESHVSFSTKLLSERQLKEIVDYFSLNFKLPQLETSSFEKLIRLMKMDKKNISEKINFTLLNKIGKGSINHHVDENEILKALNFYVTIASR